MQRAPEFYLGCPYASSLLLKINNKMRSALYNHQTMGKHEILCVGLGHAYLWPQWWQDKVKGFWVRFWEDLWKSCRVYETMAPWPYLELSREYANFTGQAFPCGCKWPSFILICQVVGDTLSWDHKLTSVLWTWPQIHISYVPGNTQFRGQVVDKALPW